MAKKAWTNGNFVYLRTGWLKIASFSLELSHRFQLTIFGFLLVSSFSRRVYVRSLCCEYPASFIMKLELIIMIKKKDSPWKRDWGERGNGLFIVQEISVTYWHCIVLCAISEILSLILRSVILARSFALRIVGHSWSLYHPIVWQILFRWWSYWKGVN